MRLGERAQPRKTRAPGRIAYLCMLAALSGLVLASFVYPSKRHAGINSGERVRWTRMVEGSASRPYVCRVLLPMTVRVVTAVVPDRFRRACADVAQRNRLAGKVFHELGWESAAAFEFLLAACLMFLCFAGFGHCAARLTLRLCDLPDTTPARAWLAAGALLGLPAFFRYTSYPYDPPQVFLFTLALLLLARHRTGSFFAVFLACCLNKETAVLLIPLYGLEYSRRHEGVSWRHLTAILGLAVVYAGTQLTIGAAFRSNPGPAVEYHLGHNLRWLMAGWTFTDLLVFATLGWLVSFRWREKPAFLRRALLCVLPPLLMLALFLGYADEWRGYYEAYPILFGLIVHSLTRLDARLRGGPSDGVARPVS
jgi:hypothetical protein